MSETVWQFFLFFELEKKCFTTFLPFDRKRYIEATNNCTQSSTHHNLCDANRHTLVKWCGYFCLFVCFFFIEEKRASPKHICTINISIDVQMVNGVKHR